MKKLTTNEGIRRGEEMKYYVYSKRYNDTKRSRMILRISNKRRLHEVDVRSLLVWALTYLSQMGQKEFSVSCGKEQCRMVKKNPMAYLD